MPVSSLKNVLNRISHWMEAKNSFPIKDGQVIAPFRPGLSDANIIQLTSSLPFEISKELKELYKWHNGDWSELDHRYSKAQQSEMTDYLYVNPGAMYKLRRFVNEEVNFFSLASAASDSGWGYAYKFDKKPYVPIFADETGHYSVLISETNQTPILVDESSVAFPSLISLMLSIAEMLETHDSLKSLNTFPKTRKEKLELQNRLISEVVLKYAEESMLRSASFALKKILPSWER